MNKNTKYLLLNLKNCSVSHLNEFYCEYNQNNINLLEALYNQGFIQSFVVLKKVSKIYILLRYFENKPVLKNLKFLFKPLNTYTLSYLEVCKLHLKRFVLFLNTTKGYVSLHEAKKNMIGGKTLFIC